MVFEIANHQRSNSINWYYECLINNNTIKTELMHYYNRCAYYRAQTLMSANFQVAIIRVKIMSASRMRMNQLELFIGQTNTHGLFKLYLLTQSKKSCQFSTGLVCSYHHQTIIIIDIKIHIYIYMY